jgi:hypothetical protein
MDGVSVGVPGTAVSGGIFRNFKADHLSSFAFNIGGGNAFLAKLTGAMLAIEIAASKNRSYPCLEFDFKLVIKAFTNPVMVPWKIRNRWFNVLQITNSMHFIVTHIFREGNHCADKLAFIGLSIAEFSSWNEVQINLI